MYCATTRSVTMQAEVEAMSEQRAEAPGGERPRGLGLPEFLFLLQRIDRIEDKLIARIDRLEAKLLERMNQVEENLARRISR